MHDLAKKLREKGKGVDKAQLEKMREALKKAGEDQAKRAEALNDKREELKQDLLKQKQKMGDAGANEQEKSLLQKKERELERLDRESEQQQKTQRELDRLDRELAEGRRGPHEGHRACPRRISTTPRRTSTAWRSRR